jgi:hypothetical protein
MDDKHQAGCSSPGKRPIIPWAVYQRRRPLVDELYAWWQEWPQANVGVAMGGASGIIGLDIDGPAGEQLLADIVARIGPLPEAPTFTTPNNGRRILFKDPGHAVTRSIRRNRKEALRLLALGSQTVMPPSLGVNGQRYEWANVGGPRRTPPDCPPALLEALAQLTEPAPADRLGRARAYLDRCAPAISGQGGHDRTFAAACGLVKHGVTPQEAFDLLRDHYNPRCQPPWSDKELWHKVEDAFRRAHGPAAPRKRPVVACTVQPATELLARTFADYRWAVPDLVPEGATLLCGRPKSGKSWLALNLAMAVAAGGVALGTQPVEPGEVLYLALEDGDRRLQKRLKRLLEAQQTSCPPTLHLATSWARSSDGGLEAIADWLKAHERARLVVIDTLARVRDGHVGNLYEEDYAALASLKALGDAHRCGVLVVHHTRKSGAEDFLDQVSGTTGLTGAADGVLVLARQRGRAEATLHVTGRDVEEERALRLAWDRSRVHWQCLGRAEEDDDRPTGPAPGTEAARVLETLAAAGRPMTATEVERALGHRNHLQGGYVRVVLRRLQRLGLVRDDAGAYLPA